VIVQQERVEIHGGRNPTFEAFTNSPTLIYTYSSPTSIDYIPISVYLYAIRLH